MSTFISRCLINWRLSTHLIDSVFCVGRVVSAILGIKRSLVCGLSPWLWLLDSWTSVIVYSGQLWFVVFENMYKSVRIWFHCSALLLYFIYSGRF